MRNSLSDAHPFFKFIFSLFIALVVVLAVFIVGFLIAIPIFQIDISNISSVLSDYSDPSNIAFLKYLQILQGIGLFIIPAIIIGYFMHTNLLEYLKLNKKISGQRVILAILILLGSLPVINYLAYLNQGMHLPEFLKGIEDWMRVKEDSAQTLIEAFLRMDSISALIFNIFLIGVLPAIGEELLFRGVFQRIFSEWAKNVHWGIVIAAFLFSAMHMQFYGFLPRFILGVLLGYLFYLSGSIWIPIIGHFVNNTFAVVVYYLYADNINKDIENLGATPDTYLLLIPSVIFVGILLYVLYKDKNKLEVD